MNATNYGPGTRFKVDVLCRRAELGLPLFGDSDAGWEANAADPVKAVAYWRSIHLQELRRHRRFRLCSRRGNYAGRRLSSLPAEKVDNTQQEI